MYRIGALAAPIAPINVPGLALAEAEAERHAGNGGSGRAVKSCGHAFAPQKSKAPVMSP